MQDLVVDDVPAPVVNGNHHSPNGGAPSENGKKTPQSPGSDGSASSKGRRH